MYHTLTKHGDVKYQFVRWKVDSGQALIEKVDTLDDVADYLTKPITMNKFSWCRKAMGLDHYT